MRVAWPRSTTRIVLIMSFLILPAALSAKTCKITLKATKPFTIMAEIADTDPVRSQGLMYRTTMRENEGMLFVFDKSARYEFWMKNTFLPLTIIFIDKHKRVVGIQDMTPLNEQKRYAPFSPYLYALEINQGLVKKIGLKEKDPVAFVYTKK